MAKLIGTAPNQTPTNADLGDLAYQDGDNAVIGPISIVDGDVVITDKIVHEGDTDTAIRFPTDNTFSVETAGTEHFRIDSSGNVGIATTSPTQKLDINDDSIRVRTAKTPASATDTGTEGQIAWDADYIYVCVATDTWKRVAIATW